LKSERREEWAKRLSKWLSEVAGGVRERESGGMKRERERRRREGF